VHICRYELVDAPAHYRRLVATCPGSLIVHTDGTVAACSNDELEGGCNGADARHQGDPRVCWRYWAEGCNHCRITRTL
jgi:hypothetical protein